LPYLNNGVNVDRGFGLKELWEVINITITGLAPLIHQLSVWELVDLGWTVYESPESPDRAIDEGTKNQVEGWLKIADEIAAQFEIPGARDRIVIFKKAFDRGLSWRLLSTESRVLRETLCDGLKGRFIYRYPNEQASILMRWQDDWAPALTEFPSARADVLAVVDCWALGHGTASVFHSMRVLEYGLAAFAHDLDEQVGVENWHTVLDKIESKIAAFRNSPRGEQKTARLAFLSQAANEFRYFKDAWRNHVSHNRASYDAHQARSVMEHVRAFMNHLASQLSEQP
jgi:hypothetical protein